MTDLLKAVLRKTNDFPDAKETIENMVASVLEEDCDPGGVLDEHGLEPDYVFDLLNYCYGKKIKLQ